MSEPEALPAPGPAPTLRASISGQRRIVQVGVLLAVAAFLVGLGVREPAIGAFVAIGVLLAVTNAVLTEHSMARMVATGDPLSKKEFAVQSLMRLGAVSLVGLAILVLFWPEGIAALVGLAAFQMMTLVMQGIPLLKELHKI